MLAVLLAVHVWFGTYSVLDVEKPGVPHLTSSQARWLHLVHAVPAYQQRWKYLRFVSQPSPGIASYPPLVVFDAQGLDQLSERDVAAAEARFHVVGEPCNAMYQPGIRDYIGTTSASCQPYVIDREPPVPGESSVLRP
jgi:hypothetical protein